MLSSPADSDITVLITSLDGTANGNHQCMVETTLVLNPVYYFYSADGDYTLLTQSITFFAGDSSVSVPIQITDDLISELAESFTLSLADQGSNLMLGDQTVASIEIVDNDGILPMVHCSKKYCTSPYRTNSAV